MFYNRCTFSLHSTVLIMYMDRFEMLCLRPQQCVAHMRRGCEAETDIKASSPRIGQKVKYSLVKGIHNGQVVPMHFINLRICPRFHKPGSRGQAYDPASLSLGKESR
jgi:hypothetical protein